MSANKNREYKMLENDAFLQLRASLHRYCLSLTKSNWEADDLMQSAWEKVMKRLRTDEKHPNLEALLLRAAKNTQIDTWRRDITLKRKIQEHSGSDQWYTEQLGEGVACELLFQALLKHLTLRQCAVFLLCEVYQYTALESAAQLRTTEGAVKAALHRARHALRKVREELLANELSLPKDEGEKQLLHTLAVSYQAGDIAALLQLVKQDSLDAAIAIAAVQNRALARKHSSIYFSEQPRAMHAA